LVFTLAEAKASETFLVAFENKVPAGTLAALLVSSLNREIFFVQLDKNKTGITK
jgi:hypothetical protein